MSVIEQLLKSKLGGKRNKPVTEYYRRQSSVSKAVGAGAWVDIPIDIPISVADGMGIAIRGLMIESDDLSATTEVFKIILSRSAVTAELYLSDDNCLDKVSFYQDGAPAELKNLVVEREYKPPIPFFGQQVHVGVYSTQAITGRVRVIYSLQTMDVTDIVTSILNFQ